MARELVRGVVAALVALAAGPCLAAEPVRVVSNSELGLPGAGLDVDVALGDDGTLAFRPSLGAGLIGTVYGGSWRGGTTLTVIGSNFGSAGPVMIRIGMKLGRPFMKSSARGADTVIYLASSPAVEGVSGRYFVNRREARSSEESYNPGVAARLWKVSEELTAASHLA